MGTYSRIGLRECYRNLQSYWTRGMLWEPTVVLDLGNAIGTYSRIGLEECYGNLQSYWTSTFVDFYAKVNCEFRTSINTTCRV